jgi:hypothetical protein
MPENTPAFFIFCTSLAKIYVLIKIRYHTKKPSGSPIPIVHLSAIFALLQLQ